MPKITARVSAILNLISKHRTMYIGLMTPAYDLGNEMIEFGESWYERSPLSVSGGLILIDVNHPVSVSAIGIFSSPDPSADPFPFLSIGFDNEFERSFNPGDTISIQLEEDLFVRPFPKAAMQATPGSPPALGVSVRDGVTTEDKSGF